MNGYNMAAALSLPVNLCSALKDGWELLGAKTLDRDQFPP